MRLKQILFIILAFVSSVSFAADDLVATMSAPQAVYTGAQFRLEINLNKEADDLKLPQLKGFSKLYGPSVSQSHSTQYANGKWSKNSSYTYTYILVANSAGKKTIAPATVVIDNKEYKTNSLAIEAVENKNQTQQNRSSSSSATSSSSNSGSPTTEDIFIRVTPSKRSLYVGDQTEIVTKLYIRPGVQLAGIDQVVFPKFDGFWSSDTFTASEIKTVRETYNGDIFNVVVLKKSLLIPQQEGKLTVKPATINTKLRVKSSRGSRDPFNSFFDSYESRDLKLTSNSLTIESKPLPTKPEGFANAVGNFKLKSKISALEVNQNDAINLTVTISGTGNIKLIDAPEILLPPDFESYDTQSELKLSSQTSKRSGTKTFKYLFQPKSHGTYTVPPIKFIYFNPKTHKYETLSGEEYTITVNKVEGISTISATGGVSKEGVKYLGEDIRFIKTEKSTIVDKSKIFFMSYSYIVIIILAIALLIASYIISKIISRDRLDSVKVKNRRASKLAKKRLKRASVLLKAGKDAEFYDEVSLALLGFVSDKLNIPNIDLTSDIISARLIERSVSPESSDRFREVVERCEFARYAPQGGDAAIENTFNDAASIMEQISKEIK